MKRLIAAAVVAAVGSVGLVGCGGGSPGGPGASNKDNKTTHVSNPDNTFTLSVPGSLPPNHIKQGDTKSYSFGIDRTANFDQDVSLKLENLPKGVTVDPSGPTIKHGDKEIKISFKAADDAAVGEFTIKVVGHPTSGADTSKDFTLHVDKK